MPTSRNFFMLLFILLLTLSMIVFIAITIYLTILSTDETYYFDDLFRPPPSEAPCQYRSKAFPVIYVVTPTFHRMEQVAELTRLSNTFSHVKNFHWIVVEDAKYISKRVEEILVRSKINFTHLATHKTKQAVRKEKFQFQKVFNASKKAKKIVKAKGVENRLKGLKWIRRNVDDGVLYFADDDNTYDLRLFDEMRFTCKVSMWPVGLVTKLGVSSPIVKENHVVGFYDGFMAFRKFAVDMAGFAINIAFLLEHPSANMPFVAGLEEDRFLRSLDISRFDIEPKAKNCTEILVWHTKTYRNLWPAPLKNHTKHWKSLLTTNIAVLAAQLKQDNNSCSSC